jgi:hypothetical protein
MLFIIFLTGAPDIIFSPTLRWSQYPAGYFQA